MRRFGRSVNALALAAPLVCSAVIGLFDPSDGAAAYASEGVDFALLVDPLVCHFAR